MIVLISSGFVPALIFFQKFFQTLFSRPLLCTITRIPKRIIAIKTAAPAPTLFCCCQVLAITTPIRPQMTGIVYEYFRCFCRIASPLAIAV
jgi:hypothetical protein